MTAQIIIMKKGTGGGNADYVHIYCHYCPVKIMIIACKCFIFSNMCPEFLVHDLNFHLKLNC